jgi:hypothetical protein
MNNMHTSKYPAIIVDSRGNSVNESLQMRLTIEQYYDLTHHTHDISSLAIGENAMTYEQMQEQISTLNNTVETQQNTINELTESIKALKELIKNSIPLVSDWDVEKEGTQDINGNDLGTLMGFNMTEIE